MKNLIAGIVGLNKRPEESPRIKHAMELSAHVKMDPAKLKAYVIGIMPEISLKKSEIGKVLELADRYEFINAGLMELVSRTPKVEFFEQRKALLELVAKGDEKATEKLRQLDAWTMQDLDEDRREKRRAYKEVMRSIRDEAHKELRPMMARRTALLLDAVDAREAKERAEAEAFGVGFIPSAPLRGMAFLAKYSEQQELTPIGSTPRMLLEDLGYKSEK